MVHLKPNFSSEKTEAKRHQENYSSAEKKIPEFYNEKKYFLQMAED